MARETIEEIGSRLAKIERNTVRVKTRQQEEDRKIQEALEDDEVREVLKLSHARDKSG